MVPMSDVTDELDDSPILRKCWGMRWASCVFSCETCRRRRTPWLIGPRDVAIIWERHILNSAAIVPFVRESTAKKQFKTVADIGSGGGFPRYRCGRMPAGSPVTLVEPMERRIEWLNECVEDMELENVTVVRARLMR